MKRGRLLLSAALIVLVMSGCYSSRNYARQNTYYELPVPQTEQEPPIYDPIAAEAQAQILGATDQPLQPIDQASQNYLNENAAPPNPPYPAAYSEFYYDYPYYDYSTTYYYYAWDPWGYPYRQAAVYYPAYGTTIYSCGYWPYDYLDLYAYAYGNPFWGVPAYYGGIGYYNYPSPYYDSYDYPYYSGFWGWPYWGWPYYDHYAYGWHGRHHWIDWDKDQKDGDYRRPRPANQQRLSEPRIVTQPAISLPRDGESSKSPRDSQYSDLREKKDSNTSSRQRRNIIQRWQTPIISSFFNPFPGGGRKANSPGYTRDQSIGKVIRTTRSDPDTASSNSNSRIENQRLAPSEPTARPSNYNHRRDEAPPAPVMQGKRETIIVSPPYGGPSNSGQPADAYSVRRRQIYVSPSRSNDGFSNLNWPGLRSERPSSQTSSPRNTQEADSSPSFRISEIQSPRSIDLSPRRQSERPSIPSYDSPIGVSTLEQRTSTPSRSDNSPSRSFESPRSSFSLPSSREESSPPAFRASSPDSSPRMSAPRESTPSPSVSEPRSFSPARRNSP
ncbi:MAG: hypothetical protein AB1656_17505 [Candidatus Omnitrophota bacterium]